MRGQLATGGGVVPPCTINAEEEVAASSSGSSFAGKGRRLTASDSSYLV